MRCHAVGQPGEPPRTYQGGGLTITLFPDGIFRLRDDTSGTPVLDLGQWAQEVDGGVRMVLRGGVAPRRSFREADGDRLIAENGSELARAATPDPIDGRYRLAGLYRDSQTGGLFAECLTGRTFEVAPAGAEPELQRAWTEATPSKEAQLYVEIDGRFVSGEVQADRFVALKRDGACPSLVPRGAALRETEWRVVEVDGDKPVYEDWRLRPKLQLDDQGRFTASTGCNAVTGTYQLDPDGLRFAPAAATLAACPPALATAETRFLEALSAARQAQIAGTTLDLLDDTGKRRLRLDARGR
jgi:heat shock protein HslJ